MAHQQSPVRLDEVLANIKDPHRWASTERILDAIQKNPSLRGMVYGYVSEEHLADWLTSQGIAPSDHFKHDDHRKTKSDRTFRYLARRYTIQVKSVQTNSIRLTDDGIFIAKVQNDASDSRKISLPDGTTIQTTCYRAGEYDILAVSLQPFTGRWEFAFKRNRDLSHSRDRKYTIEQQRYLLATLEPITYPLSDKWTIDLFSLLDDEMGTLVVAEEAVGKEEIFIQPSAPDEPLIVQEPADENKSG